MLCSCRLWPSPGMYAVTSMPEVRRTRATLRSAEFGFLGVFVYTRVQTPRRCGAPLSAGVDSLRRFDWRPFRTNCSMVGTANLSELQYMGRCCYRVGTTAAHDGDAAVYGRRKPRARLVGARRPPQNQCWDGSGPAVRPRSLHSS